MDGKGLFSLCCFVYFSFLLLCVFLFTSSFQSLSILLACDSCDSPASAFQVVAHMVECAMLNSHVFCFMGVLILLLLHLFTPRCLMFNVCFCSTSSLWRSSLDWYSHSWLGICYPPASAFWAKSLQYVPWHMTGWTFADGNKTIGELGTRMFIHSRN